MRHRRSSRGRNSADAVLAGKVLYAVLAWTAVGILAFLSLFAIPSIAHVVPLPHGVLAAIGVLRVGLSGPTLGLIFVGWLLGVVGIFTLAALRRLWRAPVVSPWTTRPAGRGA